MAERAPERAAERPLIPAFITSVEARCALGLSALQASMCYRARLGEPKATRFIDKRQRFVGAHGAPGLRGDLIGADRVLSLALPALRAALVREAPSSPMPIFIATSERGRPDDDPRLDGPILQALAEAAPSGAVDVDRSRVVRAGHAGFALALSAALEEIGRGAQAICVGAVDSYYHPDMLAKLDEECRLHALDAENGFVPGEGAAFLVLTPAVSRLGQGPSPGGPPALGAARKAPSQDVFSSPVLLRRVEVGTEDTVVSGEPNIGRAMTAALRDLAVSSPGGQLQWSFSDVNGERHRVREWDLARGRGAFADGAVHERPADELGDLGAASGGVLAALACTLFRAGAAPRSSVCVALASDGPERGAFLMSFEGGAK